MERPIRVPTVSTKAMMKMISTTGKNLRLSAPLMSSFIRMGETSGGRLTNCSGIGVTLSQMERSVVVTMPMTMAPLTLLAIRTTTRRNPATARSTEGEVMSPSLTGAPGIPGTTSPVSFRPMKVRKSPIPTAKLHLSEKGIASASQERTLKTVSSVKSTPATKTAPSATCQE